MKKIKIYTEHISVEASLNTTITATEIWNILPVQGLVNTWGDEIYFPIPVHLDLEEGQEIVQAGDLGYWPAGHAFCIFFGLTPISKPGEIRPASPVNVFGKIVNDLQVLKEISSGETITVEPIASVR